MPHPDDALTEDHAETPSRAADPAEGGADELAEIRAELDGHRARAAELEDQLLRRAAEFQNYRRRTQEDLQNAAARGRAEALAALLDVFDDLRRSREAAEQAAAGDAPSPRYDALKEGVDLVYRKFDDALAALGVRRIEALGQAFDEAVHEALAQHPSEEHPAGTVVAEVQPGYTLGDRVLRHARVIVAG